MQIVRRNLRVTSSETNMGYKRRPLIKTGWDSFFRQYRDCFADSSEYELAYRYAAGLRSDELKVKSAGTIAPHFGIPLDDRESFLASSAASHPRVRARTLQNYGELLNQKYSTAILTTTVQPKKSKMIAGVTNQSVLTVDGRKEVHGVVTVDLLASTRHRYYSVASELYLAKSWVENRVLQRRAKIPSSLEYRPNWRIGLDMFQLAREQGLQFDLIAANDEFGEDLEFLEQLDKLRCSYLVELHPSVRCWYIPRDEADLELVLTHVHECLCPGHTSNGSLNGRPTPIELMAKWEGLDGWREYGITDREGFCDYWKACTFSAIAAKSGFTTDRRVKVRILVIQDPRGVTRFYATNRRRPLSKKKLIKTASMLHDQSASRKLEADQTGRADCESRSYDGFMIHLALSDVVRLISPPVPGEPLFMPPYRRKDRDAELAKLGIRPSPPSRSWFPDRFRSLERYRQLMRRYEY